MIRALGCFWLPLFDTKLVVGSSLSQVLLSVRCLTTCAADPQPVIVSPINPGVNVSERSRTGCCNTLLNHTNSRQKNAAKRCLLKCKYTAALLKLLATNVYQKLLAILLGCTMPCSAAVITSNLSRKTANAKGCYRNPMTQCLGLGCRLVLVHIV